MKSRIVILFLFFTFLWGGLVTRTAFIQVIPNEKLETLKAKQFNRTVKFSPTRGEIFDTHGVPLAISKKTFSLFADPQIIHEPKKVSKKLAKLFGHSSNYYFKILNKKPSRFKWLHRRVTDFQYKEVNKWKIRGLGFKEEAQRGYPNGHLLSQVLGFVGNDGKGLEGLELYYDEKLSGRGRKLEFQRDARGRPLIQDGWTFYNSPDGDDIHLTINRDFQFVLEEEIRATVEEFDANSGFGIIVDPQTGAIVAMANVPTYDVNRPLAFDSKLYRNRIINDFFEPGSVMKPFLVSGVLESGHLGEQDLIDTDNGRLKFGSHVITESERGKSFGEISLEDVLVYSSNVGSAKVALQYGDDNLRAILSNFGFGQKTGVLLPGESKGLVNSLPWKEHLLSTISFGHGIAVTPMQLVMAYSVIANGGYLYKPYMVKSIVNKSEGKIHQAEVKSIRRVIKSSVAAAVRKMLTRVVYEGSGKKAQVKGYPIAGKTGTAQKVSADGKGYVEGAYISSFAGFFPADKPKYVMYIGYDDPKKKYYSSSVAAPSFSRVAQYILRWSQREKQYLPQQKDLAHLNNKEKSPVLEKISFKGAIDLLKDKSAKLKNEALETRGERKSNNFFESPVKKTNYKQTSKLNLVKLEKAPNLLGLSFREIVKEVNGTDLDVKLVGHSGKIVDSIPKPGETLGKEKKITLIFSE